MPPALSQACPVGRHLALWGWHLLMQKLCHMRTGTWYLSVLIKASRNATNYPGSLFYQQICHLWHWCIESHFPRQSQAFVCCTFFTASCFLSCHSLPLSQPVLSLIHSSIHVFICVFIHVFHQLPQSEEVTAPCVLCMCCFPCASQCVSASLRSHSWPVHLQGMGAAALRVSSCTAKKRRGSAGCTGELCCWFRVGRAVCVVQWLKSPDLFFHMSNKCKRIFLAVC